MKPFSKTTSSSVGVVAKASPPDQAMRTIVVISCRMSESRLEDHLYDVTQPAIVCQYTIRHNICDKACAFTHDLNFYNNFLVKVFY